MSRFVLLVFLGTGALAQDHKYSHLADVHPYTKGSGEEPEAQCLARLHELNQPNCGEKDPECPLGKPFHRVNITVDADFRYVQTSYCPPYDWSCLRSPKRRRPCMRTTTFKLPLKTYAVEEPLQLGLGWPRGGLPRADATKPNSVSFKDLTPMQGGIGILTNGVLLNAVAGKLSDCLEEGQKLEGEDRWVDAAEAEKWMDDQCGGHLSGGGNYHTHIGADHGDEKQKRTGCGLAVDPHGPTAHSQILGWAFDGYAIYGPHEGGTKDPTDLDACGGHDDPLPWNPARIYHYHLSESYPYSLECYHGCPEASNNFRMKDVKCEPKGSKSEL